MEVLLTFLGAFFGAVTALTSDRWVQYRREKLQEESAVNNLLLDLAAKRALSAGPESGWAPGAGPRIVESIAHTRTLIRETRLKLRPRSPYLAAIREMQRSCNTFLEESEYRNDQPSEVSLERLALSLRREAAAMHSIAPKRVVDDPPGSFAMHQLSASSVEN